MWARAKEIHPLGVIVGILGDPVVLHHAYDPRQGWLDFMAGVVLVHQDSVPVVSDPRDNQIAREYNRLIFDRQRWRKRIKDGLEAEVYVSGRCRTLFDYEWSQWVLPFWEARRIEASGEYRDAQDMWEKAVPEKIELSQEEGYEGFYEVVEDAVPLVYPMIGDMEDWLDENCQGRYYLKRENNRFTECHFERYTDWFHCKMVFAGTEQVA